MAQHSLPSGDTYFALLIAGTRSYEDYEEFSRMVTHITSRISIPLCIISGGAAGADSLAEKYALEHNIPIQVVPAKWDMYGNRAGYIRNREIHRILKTYPYRGCLCFWDGISKGTAHNFELCREFDTPLRIYDYKEKKWLR